MRSAAARSYRLSKGPWGSREGCKTNDSLVHRGQGTDTLIPKVNRALDCFFIDKRVKFQASHALNSGTVVRMFLH